MKGSVKLPVFIDEARKLVNTTQLRAKYLGASYEAEYCQWQALHGLGSLMETASLIITPNAYLEGQLLSTWPPDGSGDMSVVRATTATRVNSAGLVELVPYNLVQYSEQFDNAAWSKNLVTITANASTAPNGTSTADKIVIDNGSQDTPVVFVISDSETSIRTLSFYAKASEYNIAYARVGGVTNAPIVLFSLTGSGSILHNQNASSYSIESVGDGWYRCSMTYAHGASFAPNIGVCSATYTVGVSTVVTTGNGTSGIYIWGAQLNEGTILPYQKTETRLNIPRLDYSNGTCPSLLVEPQRTNSCLYSNDISNAAWGKINATVTANLTTAPDGTLSADKLIDNTTNGLHRTLPTVGSVAANTTYFLSCFVKKAELDYVILSAGGSALTGSGGSGADLIASVNLTNGSIVTNNYNISVIPFEDDWYRISIRLTTDVDGGSFFPYIATSQNGTTATYAGTGQGIYLWGAQLEAGSYATSYIPTTSASVTRNADVISKTGISSLIGSSEYTLFWDGKHIPTGEYNSFATCYQASNLNNSVRFYRNNSNNAIRAALFNVSSGLSLDLNSGITTENAKCALRVKSGDYAFFVNGSLVASSTSALAPSSSLDALNIQYFDATQSFQQELKGLAFWKTALTNTQLAALTTI